MEHALNSAASQWNNPWHRDLRPDAAQAVIDRRAQFATKEVRKPTSYLAPSSINCCLLVCLIIPRPIG
jgi:hypothetical protein